MTDELLLTAAKLREQVNGRVESPVDLFRHAGLVTDPGDRQVLNFMASASDRFGASDLMQLLDKSIGTNEVTEAVARGDSMTLSSYVGITAQDLDASALTLPLKILDRIDNYNAPAYFTAAGNPNTGKTNTMAKIIEMRKIDNPDLLILSNVRSWEMTDIPVTSMYDLTVALLEHRETPKAILLDEMSTFMDARTYRREVAEQYGPVAKRYAKIGVDLEAAILHTGKDGHPERKALTTTAFWKSNPKEATFYDKWDRDSAEPEDPIFSGELKELERATGYDPDDSAPWSWNLQPGLMDDDLTWSEKLAKLKEVGPALD